MPATNEIENATANQTRYLIKARSLSSVIAYLQFSYSKLQIGVLQVVDGL